MRRLSSDALKFSEKHRLCLVSLCRKVWAVLSVSLSLARPGPCHADADLRRAGDRVCRPGDGRQARPRLWVGCRLSACCARVRSCGAAACFDAEAHSTRALLPCPLVSTLPPCSCNTSLLYSAPRGEQAQSDSNSTDDASDGGHCTGDFDGWVCWPEAAVDGQVPRWHCFEPRQVAGVNQSSVERRAAIWRERRRGKRVDLSSAAAQHKRRLGRRGAAGG